MKKAHITTISWRRAKRLAKILGTNRKQARALIAANKPLVALLDARPLDVPAILAHAKPAHSGQLNVELLLDVAALMRQHSVESLGQAIKLVADLRQTEAA